MTHPTARDRCSGVLLLCSVLAGCFPAQDPLPKPLPVAQWRFVDVDTGQPIEGVWINFAWLGKPNERGMSTCARAVLTQSDADGWVRDTAREPYWRLREPASFFKPGYEQFTYQITVKNETEGEITARVNQDRTILGHYPAWEERLRELGYQWKDNYWIKLLPRGDFQQFYDSGKPRLIYLATYRSPSPDTSMPFLGYQCTDPGSENIGLSPERIGQTDRSRALASTRYLCGSEWETVRLNSGTALHLLVSRAFWFIEDVVTMNLLRETHARVSGWGSYNDSPYDYALLRSFCRDLESATGLKLIGFALGVRYED